MERKMCLPVFDSTVVFILFVVVFEALLTVAELTLDVKPVRNNRKDTLPRL